jgi:hypothetical protein
MDWIHLGQITEQQEAHVTVVLEHSLSVKSREFLDKQWNQQLVKKYSALWVC